MKLTVLRISNCNVKGALFKPLVGTLMTIGEVTVSIAMRYWAFAKRRAQAKTLYIHAPNREKLPFNIKVRLMPETAV